MKFSVLISVYIKENPVYLKKALYSLWDSQILKPSQIVIVKDGPLTVLLEEELLSFERRAPVKFVNLPVNEGLGKALQIGITKCDYNIVARMDTDDICHPMRFQQQVEYLKKHSNIDVVGTWINEFYDNEENVISVRKTPINHLEIAKMLKSRCPFNHPTVMVKKEAVLNAGNYQSEFLKEDMSLWLRMFQEGSQFGNIPENLLLFRTSKNMYKRRGGIKYAYSELKMFKLRYNIGLINKFELGIYLAVVLPIRISPPVLRKLFYKNILR